jgi:hypothetical protein
VGVSLSCGSLWFIDAGSVSYVEAPISGRFLSQDDRIEIAEGLARGEPVKVIAAQIGKSYQSVCIERSPATAGPMAAISHGSRTTRRIFASLSPTAAQVRRRRRTSPGRCRQAGAAMVAGADFALAAASLASSEALARVPRNDL